MNAVSIILLFTGFLTIIVFVLPKAINVLLLRKLADATEIERKLNNGEYNTFDSARAEYFLGYLESRGLYHLQSPDGKKTIKEVNTQ